MPEEVPEEVNRAKMWSFEAQESLSPSILPTPCLHLSVTYTETRIPTIFASPPLLHRFLPLVTSLSPIDSRLGC